jgi:hypothetical protein
VLYLKNYQEYLSEKLLSKHFVLRDPNTHQLYTLRMPKGKEKDLVRMETNYEMLRRNIDELGIKLAINSRRILSHSKKNKIASGLLFKWLKRDTIKIKEYEFIRNVAYDNLKAMGLIMLTSPLVPGGVYTLPVLFKIADRYNINLFPQAWNEIPDPNEEPRFLPINNIKLKKEKKYKEEIKRINTLYKKRYGKSLK